MKDFNELTEQASAYAKEDPYIDHKAEAKADGDVEIDDGTESDGSIRCSIVTTSLRSNIGNYRAGEGKEQEECCANEFADHGNKI